MDFRVLVRRLTPGSYEGVAMSDEVSLDGLLSLWQQERARGHDLPVALICRDRPDMAEELERRIAAVRRMDDLAAAGGSTRSFGSFDAQPTVPSTQHSGPVPSLPGY